MSSIIESIKTVESNNSPFRSIQLIEAGHFEEARKHLLKSSSENELVHLAYTITDWLIDHRKQEIKEGLSNKKIPPLSSVLSMIPFLYEVGFNSPGQSDSLLSHLASTITDCLVDYKKNQNTDKSNNTNAGINKDTEKVPNKIPDLTSLLALVPFLYQHGFKNTGLSDSLLAHVAYTMTDWFHDYSKMYYISEDSVKFKKDLPNLSLLLSLLPLLYNIGFNNEGISTSLCDSLFGLIKDGRMLQLLPKPTQKDSKNYFEIYGILQQFYLDHLLVHRYGIEGTFEYQHLTNGRFDLTGSEESTMLAEIQGSWSKFEKTSEYRNALKEIGHQFFEKKRIDEIESIFRDVSLLYPNVSRCLENNSLFEKFQLGQPIIIPVLTDEPDSPSAEDEHDDEHVFSMGVVGNLCIYFDRGAKQSGIYFRTFEDSKNCLEMIKIVLQSNQFPEHRLSEKQFLQTLKSYSTNNPSLIYRQFPQLAGTCAFASCAKGSLRIALIIKFLSIVSNINKNSNNPVFSVSDPKLTSKKQSTIEKGPIEVAIRASRHLFSCWEKFDVTDFLRNYLTVGLFTKPNPTLLAHLVIKYQNHPNRKELYEIIQTLQKTGYVTSEHLSVARDRIKLDFKKQLQLISKSISDKDDGIDTRILTSLNTEQVIDGWATTFLAAYERTSKETLLQAGKRFKLKMIKHTTSDTSEVTDSAKDKGSNIKLNQTNGHQQSR